MTINESVLDLIGKTPLISLEKICGCPCYAKMECLNPGGSIKDRIALKMLVEAIETGQLKPGMTILEPTSGNTGIALAMVAGQLGYPITIVMPENMSRERQQIIQAFGAQLILTDAKLSIGGAIEKVESLKKQGNYYVPMQFSNPNNVLAQQETAKEALAQMGKAPDIFITGIGSGGTLQGMSEVLLKANPNCQIIAVEPLGVSALKNDPPGIHAIQGIGDGFIPELLQPNLVSEIIEVSDRQAIQTCLKLAREAGLLVGISSGANLFAAQQMAKKHPNKTILTILPDRGERYLSTGIFGKEMI